jgi:hypothetical protein
LTVTASVNAPATASTAAAPKPTLARQLRLRATKLFERQARSSKPLDRSILPRLIARSMSTLGKKTAPSLRTSMTNMLKRFLLGKLAGHNTAAEARQAQRDTTTTINNNARY